MTRYQSICFLAIILLFSTRPASAQLKPEKYAYKWGFKDSTGTFVIPPVYEDVNFFSEGLVCAKKGGNWGFINEAGKTVIDFQFSDNGAFSNGVAVVQKNGKFGVINRQGIVRVPFQYRSIHPFSEGVAGAELAGRQMLIDTLGHVLLDSLPYTLVTNSVDGLIQVRTGDLFGFIDKQGTIKIPPIYNRSLIGRGFSEGLLGVGQNGQYGFIDTSGKTVIPFQYEGTHIFSDGLAAVMKNGKYGFIDHEGKLVIDFKYSWMQPFNHGKAEVTDGTNRGFIDQTGKLLGPMEKIPYSYVGAFHEGLRRVCLWGKWGFQNEREDEVIPLQYKNVLDFQEGLAAVQVNRSWGYIDKTGRMVITPMYDQAGSFSHGKAIVIIGDDRQEITMPSPEALKDGYLVLHGTPLPFQIKERDKPATGSGDRACSVCNGQGQVVKPIQNNLKQDSYGHWYKAVGTLYETCPMCHGKRTM